jgi:hypothetical protein
MKVDLEASLFNSSLGEFRAVVSVLNSADGTPVEGLDKSFFYFGLGDYVQVPSIMQITEPAAGVYSVILSGIKASYTVPFLVAVKGARGHTVFHGQTVGETYQFDPSSS